MFSHKIFRGITGVGNFVSRNWRRYLSESVDEVKYLKRGEHAIAYRVTQGESDLPGIIFCPGLQSNMMGVKANAVEEYCKKNKHSFVRFDYRGCGQSTGSLTDATLTDWHNDLLAVLDNLTAGPQIIIGSSIGGLLMLEVAEKRANRIHSLVGIATAADFPKRLASSYPKEVQQSLTEHGCADWTTEGRHYLLTSHFLDDAREHHADLTSCEVRITAPVRLLHGMADNSVPYDVSLRLAHQLWSNDVNVTLSKLSGHRFSQPEDVQLLFEMIDYLVHGADEARKLAITAWSSFTVYGKIMRGQQKMA